VKNSVPRGPRAPKGYRLVTRGKVRKGDLCEAVDPQYRSGWFPTLNPGLPVKNDDEPGPAVVYARRVSRPAHKSARRK